MCTRTPSVGGGAVAGTAVCAAVGTAVCARAGVDTPTHAAASTAPIAADRAPTIHDGIARAGRRKSRQSSGFAANSKLASGV
jgi:hypothetical protein